MAAKMHLKGADFQAKVLEGSKTQPVVVDFWAEWCGPCRAMEPTYEEVAGEYAGRASLYKLNVDEEGALAQQYGVMSIPTIMYFKDGRPVGQSVGLIDKSELTAHIDKFLTA
ncbi:MAG: thioredoxin [Patescibacteria group bacterium]|jgi:thioredoxin 1